MTFLRKKIILSFFFVLISVGQAYPFSVAFAMTSKRAACCCHEQKTSCGCDHKSEKKMKHACHEEKKSGYKSMCGGKTQEEVLSFRSEPFLLLQPKAAFVVSKQIYFQPNLFSQEDHRDPPLSPPPRS